MVSKQSVNELAAARDEEEEGGWVEGAWIILLCCGEGRVLSMRINVGFDVMQTNSRYIYVLVHTSMQEDEIRFAMFLVVGSLFGRKY